MTILLFTTSWDDGHPLDLRLAELLVTYGFRGTFYVPCRNWQGEPVLSGRELRDLGRGFEHVDNANRVDNAEVHRRFS